MARNVSGTSARSRAASRWSPYKDAKVRGKRLIAYIRVSRMDKDKISPEVQLSVIKEYAARMGLTVVLVVQDLDLSGRKSDKRQLGKIIKMIDDGDADGVVVWKISRWGRNHLDSMRHILDLQGVGGYITSATENLDDIETPMGKFGLSTMLAIAQLQSDQIGETWANIHDYRVNDLKVPATGGPRFGYVYFPSKGQDPGSYKVDREEPYVDEKTGEILGGGTNTGALLAECYAMYVSGKSMGTVIRWLDGKAKTSRGRKWTYGPLLNALDSGFGAGKIVRGNTKNNAWGLDSREWVEGGHEAVISEQLWESYLARRRRPVPARQKTAPYRLAGLIYCAGCGRRMVLNHRVVKEGGETLLDEKGNAVKKRLVRCYLMSKSTQSAECPAPATMHMDRIEEVVEDWLNTHRLEDQYSQVVIQRQSMTASIEANVEMIEKDIEAGERRLTNAAKKLAEEAMSDFSYKLLEKQTEQELADLRAKMEEAQQRKRVNAVPLPGVFDGLHAAWKGGMSPETMNEGLRQVISKIYVGRANEPGALARTRGIGGKVRVVVVPHWEEEEVVPLEAAAG